MKLDFLKTMRNKNYISYAASRLSMYVVKIVDAFEFLNNM
jgi:hypothetical protein